MFEKLQTGEKSMMHQFMRMFKDAMTPLLSPVLGYEDRQQQSEPAHYIQ